MIVSSGPEVSHRIKVTRYFSVVSGAGVDVSWTGDGSASEVTSGSGTGAFCSGRSVGLGSSTGVDEDSWAGGDAGVELAWTVADFPQKGQNIASSGRAFPQ